MGSQLSTTIVGSQKHSDALELRGVTPSFRLALRERLMTNNVHTHFMRITTQSRPGSVVYISCYITPYTASVCARKLTYVFPSCVCYYNTFFTTTWKCVYYKLLDAKFKTALKKWEVLRKQTLHSTTPALYSTVQQPHWTSNKPIMQLACVAASTDRGVQ